MPQKGIRRGGRQRRVLSSRTVRTGDGHLFHFMPCTRRHDGTSRLAVALVFGCCHALNTPSASDWGRQALQIGSRAAPAPAPPPPPPQPAVEYWPVPMFWPINREFPGLRAVSVDPAIFVVDDLLDEAQRELVGWSVLG